MRIRTLWAMFLALFAAIGLFGCAGGGDGGAGGGANGRLAVYATDSLRTDFDHVWVTIYSISLNVGSTEVVVFNDVNGRVVDLKTLRDQAGEKFHFLDAVNVPNGPYPAARVVMNKNLSLVANGQTNAQIRQFADAYDANGRTQVSFQLSTPIVVSGGNNNLVLDFDLANWDFNAQGQVTVRIDRGQGQGLDDADRHVRNEVKGTISNLSGTAPNQTFTLSRGNSLSLQVQTNAQTDIFNENGSANPRLQNGQKVEARGAFVGGVFVATSIKIDTEVDDDPHEAKGTFSNVNSLNSTFTLSIRQAEGFVPSGTTITVEAAQNARFFDNSGVAMTRAEFFAALSTAAAGTEVEVEGTFAADVFTAVKLKIDNPDGPDEHEVRGDVTAENETAGTLTISADEWEGISLTPGQSVNVVTNSLTTYEIESDTVTKTAFFAAVQIGSVVKVKGSFDGSIMTATRLRLRLND